MTDEEIIAVVTAHKEGKTIEVTSKGELNWEVTSNPCWDFVCFDYRIKPEPHYRPFKDAKEVMEAIKEHGDWVVGFNILRIVEISKGAIWAGAKPQPKDFEEAFREYTFADGHPFGKLVEE